MPLLRSRSTSEIRLDALPADLLARVLSFVDGRQLGVCEVVSHGLRATASSSKCWRGALWADFLPSSSER
jgi:hypothetical protein